MRTLKITLMVFILSITISAQWEWKNPLPQANSLKKIFFTDSSTGWMVGDKGTFLKTVNNSDWEVKYYDSVRANLTSVTFRNSNLAWTVSAVMGVVEEGRVFKTSDGGQNWVQVSIFNKDLYDVKFVTDDIGWVVGFGIISKTTDGGISWNDQLSDPLARFYTCYFADSLKGWAAGYVGSEVYHTQDGGATWNRQNLNPAGTYFSITFSDVNNGWIAGHTLNGNYHASLFRSTDGGGSWFEYAMTGSGLTNITFINDTLGWITNDDGNIIKTSDGGNSWLSISSVGAAIDHLVFLNLDKGWLINPKGIIRKTTDGGLTWLQKTSGSRGNIKSAFFIDSLKGTIIQSPAVATLKYTQDGAKTWTVSYGPSYYQTIEKITFVDSLYGWACGYGYPPYPTSSGPLILKTTNGGQSWVSYQPTAFGMGTWLSVLEFVDRQIGFTSCYGIWKTTDGGWNWNIVCPNTTIIYDIFFLNTLIGWATEYGGIIYKTTNGGNSWEQITPGVTIHKLFFLNEDDGWGDNGSSLFQTTDGGYTWEVQIAAGGSITDYWISDDNNIWIVGGKTLKSTDGGQSWQSFWQPANYIINSVQFVHNNKLGWFTGGEGTILKYYNDEPSSIETEEFDNTFLDFNLSNNYPNPFNPVTKIKYSISFVTLRQAQGDINVILKVYDILGREIATLVNEEKPAGEYEIEFNAANLPSGIYFYQLKSGTHSETKKMVLLK